MKVLRKAFKQPLNDAIAKFVNSISTDKYLVETDITGSLAHVEMLEQTGIITADQAENIKCGLHQIKDKYATGELELLEEFEDVHMNVEKQLEQLIGKDALRLHSARSRNDQVALDTRLYTLAAIEKVCALLKQLQLACLLKAQQHKDAVMPGYTHLQRAQPVLFAHAMLAFVEMFDRDKQRFADAQTRCAVSPLGAGAQAGSGLPINPYISAAQLGLSEVFANSIDAVTDRDFVLEFLAAASIAATHLSQMAETLVIWNTKEFGFVEFDDSVTTTSSLMPQKKNPDPIELVRGKAGSVYGNLINVFTTLKALPLGYNRDLQEVKPALVEAVETLTTSLEVMAIAIQAMAIRVTAMESAAGDPELMATDLVEYLVRKGCPFREAHETISELVGECRESGFAIDALTLAQFKRHSVLFEADVAAVFSPVNSVAAKVSPGSTGSSLVPAAIAKKLASL